MVRIARAAAMRAAARVILAATVIGCAGGLLVWYALTGGLF